VIVEIDEARKRDPAGDRDRLAFGRRLARQIGNPAVLDDDQEALDRHLPAVHVNDRPIGSNN